MLLSNCDSDFLAYLRQDLALVARSSEHIKLYQADGQGQVYLYVRVTNDFSIQAIGIGRIIQLLHGYLARTSRNLICQVLIPCPPCHSSGPQLCPLPVLLSRSHYKQLSNTSPDAITNQLLIPRSPLESHPYSHSSHHIDHNDEH